MDIVWDSVWLARIFGSLLGTVIGYSLPVIVVSIIWGAYKLYHWLFVTLPTKYKHNQKAADQARIEALRELEEGTVDQLLWATAIEQSNGNHEYAKSIYIKLRAKKASNDNGVSDQKRISFKFDEYADLKTGIIMLTLLVEIVWFFMVWSGTHEL